MVHQRGVELYNARDDPHELINLARGDNVTKASRRLLARPNALLLVAKSCTMDPAHNAFFASLPEVRFGRRM